jgi:hypothetical protein
MRSSLLVVILVAACGGGGGSHDPDARGAADAPMTADAPGATAGHVVYLAFDGENVMPGADDPIHDTTPLPSKAYTAKYLPSDAARATKIAAIVDEARAILAPYDIALVTTRPASGTYDLIVVGGSPTDAGFSAGLNALSIAGQCNLTGTHVALIFDVGLPQHEMVRMIISLTGMAHNVSLTKKPDDCMCYADAACAALSAACTIGGAGTTVDASFYNCAGGPTTDEQQAWLTVFGAAK